MVPRLEAVLKFIGNFVLCFYQEMKSSLSLKLLNLTNFHPVWYHLIPRVLNCHNLSLKMTGFFTRLYWNRRETQSLGSRHAVLNKNYERAVKGIFY